MKFAFSFLLVLVSSIAQATPRFCVGNFSGAPVGWELLSQGTSEIVTAVNHQPPREGGHGYVCAELPGSGPYELNLRSVDEKPSTGCKIVEIGGDEWVEVQSTPQGGIECAYRSDAPVQGKVLSMEDQYPSTRFARITVINDSNWDFSFVNAQLYWGKWGIIPPATLPKQSKIEFRAQNMYGSATGTQGYVQYRRVGLEGAFEIRFDVPYHDSGNSCYVGLPTQARDLEIEHLVKCAPFGKEVEIKFRVLPERYPI